MSVQVSNILKNHELRIRELEKAKLETNIQTIVQPEPIDLTPYDKKISELQSVNSQYKSMIQDLVERNHAVGKELNIYADKYNKLYELHTLFHYEFLRFKQEVLERDRMKINIEESISIRAKDVPAPAPAPSPVPPSPAPVPPSPAPAPALENIQSQSSNMDKNIAKIVKELEIEFDDNDAEYDRMVLETGTGTGTGTTDSESDDLVVTSGTTETATAVDNMTNINFEVSSIHGEERSDDRGQDSY
jgi:hypothetical protein